MFRFSFSTTGGRLAIVSLLKEDVALSRVAEFGILNEALKESKK
jgi:hypothetical protein